MYMSPYARRWPPSSSLARASTLPSRRHIKKIILPWYAMPTMMGFASGVTAALSPLSPQKAIQSVMQTGIERGAFGFLALQLARRRSLFLFSPSENSRSPVFPSPCRGCLLTASGCGAPFSDGARPPKIKASLHFS